MNKLTDTAKEYNKAVEGMIESLDKMIELVNRLADKVEASKK